jgi:hypothetical protein
LTFYSSKVHHKASHPGGNTIPSTENSEKAFRSNDSLILKPLDVFCHYSNETDLHSRPDTTRSDVQQLLKTLRTGGQRRRIADHKKLRLSPQFFERRVNSTVDWDLVQSWVRECRRYYGESYRGPPSEDSTVPRNMQLINVNTRRGVASTECKLHPSIISSMERRIAFLEEELCMTKKTAGSEKSHLDSLIGDVTAADDAPIKVKGIIQSQDGLKVTLEQIISATKSELQTSTGQFSPLHAPMFESSVKLLHSPPSSHSDSTNDYFTEEDSASSTTNWTINEYRYPLILLCMKEEIVIGITDAFRASEFALKTITMAGSEDSIQTTNSSGQIAGSSSNPLSEKSDPRGTKRKRDDESPEDEDDYERHTKVPRSMGLTEEDVERWLACPFYKKDPTKYKCCRRSRYDAINRIK